MLQAFNNLIKPKFIECYLVLRFHHHPQNPRRNPRRESNPSRRLGHLLTRGPVVYPHAQKTKDYWILNPFIVIPFELLGVPDHVRPQGVIRVQVMESVIRMTIFTTKDIPVLLSMDPSTNNASVTDLKVNLLILNIEINNIDLPG